MRLIFVFIELFCFIFASATWASPAIVYTGKWDQGGYNISLHKGIQEFRAKTGQKCIEIQGSGDSEYLETILHCIKKNYSPIILPYSNQFSGLMDIIRSHKKTDFVFLDFGDVDLPNVWAFSFADAEGAFLAGSLAALMTRSKTIGFIYTSDQYSVLLRFRIGYIKGARVIDPDIKVLESQLGNHIGVWHDTDNCSKIAAKLINQGADVIFTAAGFAGTGALSRAAMHDNVYAIGVDSNQNHLYPGTMIGSMIKRNDKAIFIALKLASAGIHRDGIKRLGLAQNAMIMDFEGVNDGLVPEIIKKRLKSLKADIIRGKLIIE